MNEITTKQLLKENKEYVKSLLGKTEQELYAERNRLNDELPEGERDPLIRIVNYRIVQRWNAKRKEQKNNMKF